MWKNLHITPLLVLIIITLSSYDTDALKNAGIPDSLIKKLSETTAPSQQVSNLIDVGFMLASNNPQLAIEYGENALKTSNFVSDGIGQMNAHNIIGLANYRIGSYDIALTHFQLGLKLASEYGNKQTIASIKSNMALVYNTLSNFERALELNFQALELRKQLNDSNAIAISYNNIGNCFHYEKNYRDAIKYYKQALAIRQNLENKEVAASTIHNIGQVYFELYTETNTSTLDSALSFFLRAYQMRLNENNKTGCSESLLNIGNVYALQNKYIEAANSYRAAINIQNQLSDKSGLSLSIHNMGLLMLKQKNTSEAIDLLNKSLSLARAINHPDLIKDNLKYLSAIYADKKEIAKAYLYLKEFTTISDSLAEVLSSEQFQFVQNQLKIQKKELHEIQLQSIHNCKLLKKGFILVSSLLIISLAFVFWYFIIKKNDIKPEQDM